jgi:hypothetical protein
MENFKSSVEAHSNFLNIEGKSEKVTKLWESKLIVFSPLIN